ncbi:ankyrin repeat-containing protein [Anaeramoeba flamelloides]|uniref:Ankyrin repeat-containing protein n=1 Tax=Anaeramoeba flamelloides TaxID=1746091 RepID=A0ABQ8XLM8_9EUKA|nr:ankyrin repeat-containing protein [Anaeramoeba flamelloides]
MEFWLERKNQLVLSKAPKNVVIEFIKNNCDKYPGLPIAELLSRKKFETFWIEFGLEHKGYTWKYSRDDKTALELVITRSKPEENFELIEKILESQGLRDLEISRGLGYFCCLCKQPNVPIEMFSMFFRYGADPNKVSNFGRRRQQTTTPFSCLLQNESYEDVKLFEMFLDRGADPEQLVNSNTTISNLFKRSRLPKMSTVKYFLDKGFSIKQPSGGIPILVLVCNKNIDQDYLRFLLQNGCEINPKYGETFRGSQSTKAMLMTPLQVSIVNNQRGTLRNLLENGADTNLSSPRYSTALSTALSERFLDLDLVKLFQKYGADFNKKNEDGHTILTLLFAHYYYHFFPKKKPNFILDRVRVVRGRVQKINQILK